MRAILLAKATRTSIGGLQVSMRAIHEPAGAPAGAPGRAAQRRTVLAPIISRRRRQAAQSSLAHLRGRPQLLLAARRMLERGQPHPGGKVPPAPEGLRRGCQGRQGDRGHRADPGDGHKPMRRFVRLGPLDDLTVQKRDLRVQPMKRVDQDLEDRSGDLRERLVRVHNSLHQLGDMSWSFGHDKAELGQMPAQGIDDLGPLPHQEIARPEYESCGLGLLAFGACSLLGATTLGATTRMVGRWAASQIASASVALFFCRLTKGLT
jgi:hypothetical protein